MTKPNSATLIILCFLLCFFLQISTSISHLLLPLTHSLSTTQFTSAHHLLKSTSSSSSARFHLHHHRHRQRQVSLPLSPGTDYTLSLTLNSKTHISLYLDTGSDLVWLPCRPFECILCEGETQLNKTSLIAGKLSSSSAAVPCKSPACSAVHSNLPSSDLCAISGCGLDLIETSDCGKEFSCPEFYYAYGDGSLVAKLYTDAVTLPLASPSLRMENFTFGCAHTALAEPVGVAGFGRGILSLPAQLAAGFPRLASRFSYCLVSHSFDSDKVRRPSPLILGRLDEKEEKGVGGGDMTRYVYTSLLDNPKHPYFYTVGLVGISVGKRYIQAPNLLKRIDREGTGGLVVDSGTTYTMLPGRYYDAVVTEFDNRVGQVHKRAKGVEGRTGLSPCYYYDIVASVPSMILHFSGNRSSVEIPKMNYFYEFLDGGDGAKVKGKKRKVGCLTLMNGGDEAELRGGPGGTLGNYQQQGFEVVYDLEKGRVGFGRRECSSLWESLNQG
ncbi:Probable aspartyl protease At4g16563 [Linum grandiflorum]